MINFERPDIFGGAYLVSYTGGRVFHGPDLVEPETSGGYWLQHPDRPDQAEEWSYDQLWALAFGVLIPGFSSYTINAAGRVYDNEGNRLALTSLPHADNRGNHRVDVPAVSIIADDGSEHTVRISDLLKMIDVHIPGTARTPSHVIDTDPGEPPGWFQRLGGIVSSAPPADAPPPPAAPSTRGRMGASSNRRGRIT